MLPPSVVVTQHKELAVTIRDRAVIIVTGERQLSDADWSEFCEACATLVERVGACDLVFNYSPLVGPNLQQRSQMLTGYRKRLELGQLKAAVVVSDSMLTRGAMTAMGWLLPGLTVRAFQSYALREAAAWARPNPEAAAVLLETTQTMIQALR